MTKALERPKADLGATSLRPHAEREQPLRESGVSRSNRKIGNHALARMLTARSPSPKAGATLGDRLSSRAAGLNDKAVTAEYRANSVAATRPAPTASKSAKSELRLGGVPSANAAAKQAVTVAGAGASGAPGSPNPTTNTFGTTPWVPPHVRRLFEPNLEIDLGGARVYLHERASPLFLGTADAAARASGLRTDGEPLSTQARQYFEPRFGADLSIARLHTGADADLAAKELGARAFTIGRHIAFRAGEYNPGSAMGRRVLAHELAHVVQQSGAVGASGGSAHRSLESEAELAAEQALAGRVPRLSSLAVAIPQALQAPDATGLENIPVTTMSVSFDGLLFTPPKNAKLSTATSWLRQVVAAALKRLLGPRYETGKLENDAISAHKMGPEGWLADSAAEQKAKYENKPASYHKFLWRSPLAVKLIEWLRNGSAGEKYAVDILPSQEELLRLGLELADLWALINKQAAATADKIPAWYSETIFRMDMNNFGDALRAFDKAAGSEKDVTANAVLQSILPAVKAMEAIRVDTALAAKPEYALLWAVPPPKKTGTSAPPPQIASENTFPALTGVPMLVFERTQPGLMENAPKQGADGQSARLELLTRFGRFFERLPFGEGGDQKLLSKPGSVNTRPFPARLTAYPPPGFPIPQEPIGSEISFIMSLDVKDFWEAWASLSYEYEFHLIKIPEERYLNKATPEEKGEAASRWKQYKNKLARDKRYNAADVLRIMGNQQATLGDPGTTVGLATLNALLRYGGTTISSAIHAVADPSNKAEFDLPEEGLYLVRCFAAANTPENAEVKRPASVAYLQIFGVDRLVLAESELQTELGREEQAQNRLKEITDLLNDKKNPPDAATREALLKEKAKIDKQGTVEGAIAVARQDLLDLVNSADTAAAEKTRLNERIKQLDLITEMRKNRGLEGKKTEHIPAVFVGDDGNVITLVLEAVDQSPDDWPKEKRSYYVSDATTKDSGRDAFTATLDADDIKRERTAREKAILGALKKILEGTMGYGRGNVAVVIDGGTKSERIEASKTQILIEGLSNLATVASVAAIAAAPFTGGESLVLLIPIGVIGAIPSAYRLATRAEAGNLRNDLNTWMDVINIVSAFVGLGGETQAVKQLAKQAILVRGGLMITSVGLHGTNVILMGADVAKQLDEVKNLPPELQSARIAEIIESAAVNAGIMIGGMLAAKYRIAESTGVHEKSTSEWKESLSPKTREVLKEPGVLAKFMEMTARVREVLTHCSDYCIPKNVTKEQTARLEKFLEKVKATPDDERAIKIYFHDNVTYDEGNSPEQQKKMESAIKALEDLPTAKELRAFLDKTVPVSDRVLGMFERLRNDPDLQKLVKKIVDPAQGDVSVRLLGDIMDQVKTLRVGAERLLGYIDKLTTKKPSGYERVLADLGKGYNFFTGAEWVLRFITEKGLWEKVKAFEIEETDPDGTRRWDAKIGQSLFQFKSWLKFYANTFIKQIHQDFLKSGGLAKFLVQWVFDAKIGDLKSVKAEMINALDAEMKKPTPRITQAEADAIKARIDDILVVGL